MIIEEEIAIGRRAFPETQRLLDGPVLQQAANLQTCGWHGTLTHPEDGAFALVSLDRTEWRGETVRVTAGDRSVLVYVIGSRDLPVDISLTRRAFMALAPLYRESLIVRTAVLI